ncbi:MAG: GNAT family N-acetyltransferase [Planctomycetota bacterium]|nr:MAG: GNAT family N-acetyltransferase [Planctomycetota bacterium]
MPLPRCCAPVFCPSCALPMTKKKIADKQWRILSAVPAPPIPSSAKKTSQVKITGTTQVQDTDPPSAAAAAGADSHLGTGFHAKVSIDIRWSRFHILTAEDEAMREKALRLRHDVFLHEILGRSSDTLVDQDDFDDICDHLLILEAASLRPVGTYRFISSSFSQRFYTQTEFDLGNLLNSPGDKLEMGRACIHPEFRNGFTFIALWKGLAGYISRHRVSRLFGCSSINNTDPATIAAIQDYLQRHDYVDDSYGCQPLPTFRLAGLVDAQRQVQSLSLTERVANDGYIEAMIPPLLWAYLEAGAKVVSSPAYDADFACMDFLTVLNTDRLRDDLVRKYKPW